MNVDVQPFRWVSAPLSAAKNRLQRPQATSSSVPHGEHLGLVRQARHGSHLRRPRSKQRSAERPVGSTKTHQRHMGLATGSLPSWHGSSGATITALSHLLPELVPRNRRSRQRTGRRSEPRSVQPRAERVVQAADHQPFPPLLVDHRREAVHPRRLRAKSSKHSNGQPLPHRPQTSAGNDPQCACHPGKLDLILQPTPIVNEAMPNPTRGYQVADKVIISTP